jgi:CRISPR-associated protein Cas1
LNSAFPPIERYRFVLELDGPVRFRFFHGSVLMGLLWNALGGREGAPFPDGVIPYACESGRVHYRENDRYHILVTFVGEDRRWAPVLAQGLRRIGDAAWRDKGPRPLLRGNFALAEEPLAVPLAPFPEAAEAAAEPETSATLLFLSPLNLDRPKSAPPGPPFWDRTFFPPQDFLRHVINRCRHFSAGRAAANSSYSAPAHEAGPPSSTLDQPRLFVLDGPEGKKGIVSRGVIGRVTLRNLPPGYLPWLALGQALHVGNYVHYGMGRYTLWPPQAEEVEALRPARTLAEMATGPSILNNAAQKAIKAGSAPGVDGMTPEEAASNLDVLLPEIRRSVRSGDYSPSPYKGLLLRKPNGGWRPVCVSTFRDRIAQRAVCDVLGPILETLLEDGSFAYRKGRSRKNAAEAIETARALGYEYALKADIEAFFDAVPWPHLLDKLAALFPFEPLLDDIREWVMAPVLFDGRLLHRERGLPQGAVISPLLANLVLDEMDETLLGKGFKVIRYADDFVIACRSAEEALRAKEEAAKVLEGLSLSLNEAKTQITGFEQGFTYLGYLFKRSQVLEKAREEGPPVPDAGTDLGRSWLGALFGMTWPSDAPLVSGQGSQSEKVIHPEQPTIEEEHGEDVAALEALAPANLDHLRNALNGGKHHLYFSTPGTKLQARDGLLKWDGVEEAGEGSLPLREIAHVVIATGVYASTPTLVHIARQGIPVYLVHANGELAASFVPAQAAWPLWLAQASFLADPMKQLSFCRQVVSAKLHNAADLCVRLRLPQGQEAAEAIRQQERACRSAASTNAVRGHEGQGAALFFAAYKGAFSSLWKFQARKRYPPPDPVNAMLSFGYASIYHYLATDLTIAGLNPRAGIFHQEHGAYAALACDLQEEFRHIVDGLVLSLVRRREVTPEDFTEATPPRKGILMASAFRKKFIEVLNERLGHPFTPPGEAEEVTYRAFMARQAAQIKALVEGKISEYVPLRRHP